MTEIEHDWTRYVAIGDSFTEGVGDPEPSLPNGLRGWADRVAEELARTGAEGFAYGNLAIRGRLLDQIAAEQLEPCLALKPDLISVSAGGNDLIRPGADPDAIAERFARLVSGLRSDGATVLVFTGVDVRFQPVFGTIRGRVAIYNENIRAIAAEQGCLIADQWALRSIQRSDMWGADRLHMNTYGHHEVARMALDALGVAHGLKPMQPEPLAPRQWRTARRDDLVWAREHLMPWVVRRIRRQSSGDAVSPKRPEAAPFLAMPPAPAAEPGDQPSV